MQHDANTDTSPSAGDIETADGTDTAISLSDADMNSVLTTPDNLQPPSTTECHLSVTITVDVHHDVHWVPDNRKMKVTLTEPAAVDEDEISAADDLEMECMEEEQPAASTNAAGKDDNVDTDAVNQDVVHVPQNTAVHMDVDEEPIADDTDAVQLSKQPVLVLRRPQRRPPGRPAANRQRLFDRKVKSFEKLGSMEKDTIRLWWFVEDFIVRDVLRGMTKITTSDLRPILSFQVFDDRGAVDELKQYFCQDSWDKVCELRAEGNVSEWPCHTCSGTTSNRSKWVQCDHCLSWNHYTCVGVTRKPKGRWFCAGCK